MPCWRRSPAWCWRSIQQQPSRQRWPRAMSISPRMNGSPSASASTWAMSSRSWRGLWRRRQPGGPSGSRGRAGRHLPVRVQPTIRSRARLPSTLSTAVKRTFKNIDKLVRVWRWSPGAVEASTAPAVLALPDKPSIAVLPFTIMSGDSEQEFFADGITEDIITELSRFRSLFVIARNSTFTFKGQAGRHQRGRPSAWCALCSRGQRAQGGQPGPRDGPADRGRQAAAISGPNVTTATLRTSLPYRTR